MFEEHNRRVNLLLDCFWVNTEIDAHKIFVTFKLRGGAKCRPLEHATAALEKTQNSVFVSRALQAVAELAGNYKSQRTQRSWAKYWMLRFRLHRLNRAYESSMTNYRTLPLLRSSSARLNSPVTY